MKKSNVSDASTCLVTTRHIAARLRISTRAAQRWKQRFRERKWGYLTLSEFVMVFADDSRISVIEEVVNRVSGDERRRSRGQILPPEDCLL